VQFVNKRFTKGELLYCQKWYNKTIRSLFKCKIVFKEYCSHFRNKTNRVINNFDCSKKVPSWGEGRRNPGGALPLMAYAGRLRLKGVSFSEVRYIKV